MGTVRLTTTLLESWTYILAMPVLSLSFEDNGTQHSDLLFRLGRFERRCDTFYLALDNYLNPEREDPGKVVSVLMRLLEQWQAEVAALGPGQVTFLPYEFDDQASGWVQVSAVEVDTVELLPVWSGLEGWAFCPSSIAEGLSQIGSVTPVWRSLSPTRASRREPLADIDRSLREAQSLASTLSGTAPPAVLTTETFVDALWREVPEASGIIVDHVKANGEILIHVLLGDITRFVIDARERGLSVIEGRCLQLLDRALRVGDDAVRDAVAVSFVENTGPWEPLTKTWKLTWPLALRAEADRQASRPSA